MNEHASPNRLNSPRGPARPRREWLARLCLLALLACFGSPNTLALSPDMRFHQFEHSVWSIQDGLPQVTVLAVVQGPEGYIWTGTQAGLSRFDGTRFEAFDPDQYPALPSRLTQALYVDSDSRLWVGTLRGAAVWRDGRFDAVGPEDERSVDVRQFAETDDGAILAATGSGLWRAHSRTLEHHPGDPAMPLRAVYHDNGGTLVGGRGVILRHDGGQWRREPLPATTLDAVVSGFARYDGRLWAASSRGLLVRQREEGRWERYERAPALAGRVVEVIYRDAADTLWVGTNGQLFRLRGDRVIDRVGGEGPFSDGNVLSIAEDHEGSLWLGSRSYGLARLWDGYVLRYAAPEGLHQGLTWALAPDETGALWVGTSDGLSRFADGRFHLVVAGDEQPHPHAYSLLPERKRVWVGTRSGLYWWRRDTEKLERPAAFAPLDGNQVNAVLRRADGYWLAADSGIWHWDGERLEQRLAASENSDHQARVLMETHDGRLLAGTLGGILAYRPGEGFRPLPGLGRGHDVMAMLQLRDGRLVAGTRDEKLLARHGDRWRVMGVEDGLPANASFALVEFGDNLWVSGNRGLYRIALGDLEAFLEGNADSLATEMIVSERGDVRGAQGTPCCNGAGNARAALLRGAMWFPTRQGIVAVDPGRIARNPHPPRVAIDRVRVNDRWQPLTGPGPLELDASRRDLDIGFTALSFQDPGSVRLSYRLRGYDDSWQSPDDPARRVAYYTNLPPGEFRFQVRGSNNVGVQAPGAAELSIHIAPHWYETATARGLGILGALLLVGLAFRLNTRRMSARQRELSQQVAERTEELRVANRYLQEYSRKLEAASMTDPLTGLWNRRYLNDQIVPRLRAFQQQPAEVSRRGDCMLFALIDLDHFKRVNDHFGHDAGDQVLRQFADFLRTLVHPRDQVLRWGGEEFLVVFNALPEDQMAGIARRMVDALRKRGLALETGQPVELTCSIGLARFPALPGDTAAGAWKQAVALADKALYQVKRNGRDGWCLVEATTATPEQLASRGDAGLEVLERAGLVRVKASYRVASTS